MAGGHWWGQEHGWDIKPMVAGRNGAEPGWQSRWAAEVKSWDFSGDCSIPGALLSQEFRYLIAMPAGTDLDIKMNGNNLINGPFHLL